ncbi:MobA/MobL family protein [Xanthobacter sp. VTT E-85241]|uniref:MobA/MobL family protein n=1 Tax=Roseixanthobacter finlandensis TaxID=3119922 RepID=UPI0037266916
MAKAAYFRLEHSAVNRASKGDGYLSAHANYAANTNKCTRVIHINGHTNRHAIQRLIADHEQSVTRKNARLADKILLSLPVELSEAHRHQAVQRFLRSITFDGRTRAIAFYHSDHAHNPHAHVILLDRDVETGQPVALMGANRQNRLKAGLEPNATEWLRKTWEKDCNTVFEEFGYGLEVDRRSNLERGLAAAGEHRGVEPDNDNAEQMPPDAPTAEMDSAQEPDSVAPEPEDAHDGDEDMAYVAVDERKPDELAAAERVQVARQAFQEALSIQQAIERKAHAVQRYEAAKVLAQRAAEAFGEQGIRTQAAEQLYYQAKKAYEATHGENGKAKGFTLSLFGRTLWQSRTAREASEAERRLSGASYNYEFSQKDLEQFDRQSQHEALRANELFQAAEKHVQYIQTAYGTDEEAQEALRLNQQTVKEYMADMTMAELMVMIEEGEIQLGEAVEALRIMGRDHDADELAAHEYERQQERNRESPEM